MINSAYINLKQMIHPNAVISLKIGTKSLENDVTASVWAFFSVYVISFVYSGGLLDLSMVVSLKNGGCLGVGRSQQRKLVGGDSAISE